MTTTSIKRVAALLAAATVTALTLTGCGADAQTLTPASVTTTETASVQQEQTPYEELRSALSGQKWEGTITDASSVKVADLTFTVKPNGTTEVLSWQTYGDFDHRAPTQWSIDPDNIFFFVLNGNAYTDGIDRVFFHVHGKVAKTASTVTFEGYKGVEGGWKFTATRL